MTLAEKIEKFLTIDNGYGDGDGSGYGIKVFNSHKVYSIDGVNTCITDVKLNVAKGFILNKDLTTSPCFIVKGQNKFAHGTTIADARQALMDKIFEDMDEDERIDAFLEEIDPDKHYSGWVFYEWHHKLTGSCEFGRNAFVKDNRIDLDREYTIEDFISYTKEAYGGDIIKRIKNKLERKETV